MKLFHAPLSSSARRVTITAHHLGVKFDDEVIINLGRPEDRARVLTVNSNGKIPVLVDGDLVLWESHAIMQYLCDKAGGSPLYPNELRARAEVNRWLFWSGSHLAPCVGPINYERMWKKWVTGGDADPALITRYEGFFHATAKVLDGHLADRTWVAGPDLSLADISIGATLMYAVPTKLPLDPYPRVRAFLDRVHALPGWKATEPPGQS